MQTVRSCIFAYVQNFAFLLIKIYKYQDIINSSPIMCSAISFIFEHMQDFIAHHKCASTKTFRLFTPTSKVQSARSSTFRHVQNFAYLHIKYEKGGYLMTQKISSCNETSFNTRKLYITAIINHFSNSSLIIIAYMIMFY